MNNLFSAKFVCIIFCMGFAVETLAEQPISVTPRLGTTMRKGEPLPDHARGKSIIISMDEIMERDRAAKTAGVTFNKGRNGEPGSWVVPSKRAMSNAKSGTNHIINKWGDTRMGIGFPEVVDVHGAYFAGQSTTGSWTTGIQAVGYLEGQEVNRTSWFLGLSKDPEWFDMELCGIDRLVIISEPVINGGGWYALDDFTFTIQSRGTQGPTVLDFEDITVGSSLAATNYGGLTWEHGAGDFNEQVIHSPRVPPDFVPEGFNNVLAAPEVVSGTNATGPQVFQTYDGVTRGDAGISAFPPDTMGAVGPNHFVEAVNVNFAVYDKITGAELTNVTLNSFMPILPGGSGDSRVLFDQHSGRWIILITDFNSRLYLAVSMSDDPMGSWFQTSFEVSLAADSGNSPDYPTLGVDANGIYSSAFMFGSTFTMSLFAIDKAPLIAATPSLGAVTAFRFFPFEGAIQPVHTYGAAAGEYFVSVVSSTEMRVRRINPPLFSPSFEDLGIVTIPAHALPPLANQRGSSAALDTVGDRLMMSTLRDGAIWTAHTIGFGFRAATRWYQVDVGTMSVLQTGTISDSSVNYFFPSIMVNANGDATIGFTGSGTNLFPSSFASGRLSTDPLGNMSVPLMIRGGDGPVNNVDQFGRNRFGDYSYTTLDPSDEFTFWSVQEFGFVGGNWSTNIAELRTSPCLRPAAQKLSSRHLQVTPAPGLDPVALRVEGDFTSTEVGCVSAFVQADGTLGATPVALTPAAWGQVVVSGAEIIPGAMYKVSAECPLFVSSGVAVETGLWGDMDLTNELNVLDILIAINVVTTPEDFSSETLLLVDIGGAGCVPDGSLNVLDILQTIKVVSVFMGDYALSTCPIPCS